MRHLLVLLCLVSTAFAQATWTSNRTNLPGVSSAYGAAFGNGRFVITTSGGSTGAAWSTDGLTWTAAASNVPPQGNVIFARGAFYLAAGTQVLRSTDGSVWQTVFDTGAATETLGRAIASNGTGFLVATNGLNSKAPLYRSTDGLSWGPVTTFPTGTRVDDLTFAAGEYYIGYRVMDGYLVVGQYGASSVDGVNWSGQPDLRLAHGYAGGNGRLLAVDATRVLRTTDGVTFSSASVGSSVYNAGRLLFAGGRFFASDTLLASFDGKAWTALATSNLPANPQIYGLAYGNGRYVACGWIPGSVGVAPQDVIAYLDAAAPPVIVTQPAGATVAAYYPLSLSVAVANADAATTYQWYRNGTAVYGATTAAYTRTWASLDDAGRFTVEVHNALGTVSSEPAVVKVLPFEQGGRITNVSVLSATDAAESNFILGFVLTDVGQNTKPVLVRAAGPSLAHFGVSGLNPNPRLDFYTGGTVVATNDDWGGTAELTNYSNSVGAFPFDSGTSKDAAVFYGGALHDNSVNVTGSGGTTGAILAEAYEMTGLMTAVTPRFKNISVRKRIAGNGLVTLGFVVKGTTNVRVLIRAVGPGLAGFSIANPLPNPALLLIKGGAGNVIGTNDDWHGTDDLTAAAKGVGAFDLNAASKDSALLATLAEGDYTAQVSSVDGAAGIVLVEVYVIE